MALFMNSLDSPVLLFRPMTSEGHGRAGTVFSTSLDDSDGPASPLVSIGIPTRNGARTLRRALGSARDQRYRNLEIIVSDNASEDATGQIASSFEIDDDRFRYIRRSRPLTVLEHYRAVWREARGRYFAWLADDDLISENFVSLLAGALDSRPDAVLAFGEIVSFTDYDELSDATFWDYYDFETRGAPPWRRLSKERHGGYELKGLLRREILEDYGWYDHSVSPDWPLLTYIMLSGEVIAVPGPILYNGSAEPKTGSDRARAQSFSGIERFPTAKLSWRCGLAAREAAARRGKRRLVVIDASITFLSLLWVNRRSLFRWAAEPWIDRLRSWRPRPQGDK